MSQVAAATGRQLYITLEQKICVIPTACEGFPQLSYRLLTPAAYPALSLLFCCLPLQGADSAH